MSLVRQRRYWFPSFKKYLYKDGSVFYDYIQNFHLDEIDYATSEIFLYKAVCIDTDDDLIPDWSPYASSKNYSLVYLLELETQGMPYSRNKFVIPSVFLCNTMEEARALGEKIRRIGATSQQERMFDNLIRNTKGLIKIAGSVSGVTGAAATFFHDPSLSAFASLLDRSYKLLK
jgi:hypothetical protein